MMLKRRIARPTFSSRKKPSSSGPRCVMRRFIRARVSPCTRQSRFAKKMPQIPHIIGSLSDLHFDLWIESREQLPGLIVDGHKLRIGCNDFRLIATEYFDTQDWFCRCDDSTTIPVRICRAAADEDPAALRRFGVQEFGITAPSSQGPTPALTENHEVL